MNVNISEAWSTWADLDDAAYGLNLPAVEEAALLIPILIVEIERLNDENIGLKESLTNLHNPAIEVYNSYDDPAYDWGTTSFVVLGTDDRIKDSIEDVEYVKEFNDKFQVNNGKITYVVPKVAGDTYELRKALGI